MKIERLMIKVGFHGVRHRLVIATIVKWLNRMDQL